MSHVGIYAGAMESYGSNAVLSSLELTSAARNLKTWWHFNDFLSGYYAPGCSWYAGVAGAGASAAEWYSFAGRPGVGMMGTGTTNTGSAYHKSGGPTPQGFLLGGGVYTIEADIQIMILSAAAEEFDFHFGFGDTANGDQVDGAYFRYNRAALGVNWHICTASNSARTATDSGVAVQAAVWTRLKAVVNAAATSVEYFIDGVSVGTVITNIPTVNRYLGAMINTVKSNGITARYCLVDWVWLHVDLAATR